MSPEVEQFLKSANEACRIMLSNASWKTKYELIFSDHISSRIVGTGITLDWYDPDEGYEEDVRAFVTAVAAKANELRLAHAEHSDEPYITKSEVVYTKHYNPNYGDDKLCKCGHAYYRHFDSWDDMHPVGCKYCKICREFEPEE